MFNKILLMCGLQGLFAQTKNINGTVKANLISSIIGQIKDTASQGCK